jgi:hypothetical protein
MPLLTPTHLVEVDLQIEADDDRDADDLRERIELLLSDVDGVRNVQTRVTTRYTTADFADPIAIPEPYDQERG